jgi:hypothetical protein
MSFSRLVWLLMKKQLWMSRIDLLGDPWEIALAGDQLAHVIETQPMVTLPLPAVMPERAMERSERIIKAWRRQTFVSCWSASAHESHALWRIYCPSREGVAIQTTLARLRASCGGLRVYDVTYEEPGSHKQTPGWPQLATSKRPMFAYEQEVRVVMMTTKEIAVDPGGRETSGLPTDWDPETVLENIWVHPEGDYAFMETVQEVVERYAPALKDHVLWSGMQTLPPF